MKKIIYSGSDTPQATLQPPHTLPQTKGATNTATHTHRNVSLGRPDCTRGARALMALSLPATGSCSSNRPLSSAASTSSAQADDVVVSSPKGFVSCGGGWGHDREWWVWMWLRGEGVYW